MDDLPGIEVLEAEGFSLFQHPASNRPVAATVVIPTYNAKPTLARALRSALDQTMPDIEGIVVDDASTDESWALITDFLRGNQRLRAVRNRRNYGKPVGMNRAIALARGRWIAILDADDWYHPDRLRALIAIAEARGVDMVADNQFFYDAAAGRMVGTAWPSGTSSWELSFDGFLIGSNAYRTFNLGMLKPVIRTDFIRRTALNYEERARHGQDFFHLLQFYLAGGRAVVTDAPYYYYTQPYGALSRQWSHAGRRRYDFQITYDINRRYLATASRTLTPSQAARLRKRNSRLKSLEYFYQAKECISQGNMRGAVLRLLRHPPMIGYVLRRIGSHLLRYAYHGRSGPRPTSKTIERVALRARRLDARQSEAAPKPR